MQDLLLRPLADAFLQVGVPVALLAAATAWARVRYGSRALDVLVRHRRLAPLLGALCGVVPGCGGAILVAALYLRGRASYGAAVAAMTATMGDASFVMIAIDPVLAVGVHAILLVVGTATGYAVDALGLDPRRGTIPPPVTPYPSCSGSGVSSAGAGSSAAGGGSGSLALARVEAAPRRAALLALQPSAAVLWVVAAVGSLLALPVSFQLFDPAVLAPAFGGIDPWLLLGVTGSLSSPSPRCRRARSCSRAPSASFSPSAWR